ncbi:MAG: phosphatase PAP2 family protein [Candidatus Omnitrophota bacterium]|jgi:undecaprenyl-diphosphatase
MKEVILTFDRSLFFFFQHLQRPWLDYYLAWPTRLGEWALILIVLTLAVILLDQKRNPGVIPSAVLGIIGGEWLCTLLKDIFHRPRPHVYWENVQVIFWKSPNPSFPSGHTTAVFAAAAILTHYYPRQSGWFYAIAVWVAATRLYVGVHYPTDLLAGAVLGFLCGKLACYVTGRLGWKSSQMPRSVQSTP